VTPNPLYWQPSDGGCEALTFSLNGTTRQVGAAIPLDSFAVLHDVALGTGRLVEHGWADSDGNVLLRGASFFDTQLDAGVEANPLDSTTVALMPKTWQHVAYYADSACQQGLATGPGPVAVTDSNDDAGCFLRTPYAIGGPRQATQLFEGGPGHCSPATDPSGQQTFYSVGAELPRSTFILVTAQTD
jgi:hypothetical protein